LQPLAPVSQEQASGSGSTPGSGSAPTPGSGSQARGSMSDHLLRLRFNIFDKRVLRRAIIQGVPTSMGI